MLVDDNPAHALDPRRNPDGERGGEDKRPHLRASLIPDAMVGGRDLRPRVVGGILGNASRLPRSGENEAPHGAYAPGKPSRKGRGDAHDVVRLGEERSLGR